MNEDFAVFIISHGRADSVLTVHALEAAQYRGAWYVVIDNEDDQEDEYRRVYGERILMFDKQAAAAVTDRGDINSNLKSEVFARNACWGLAKECGLKHFLVLDDDYRDICFRYPLKGVLKVARVKDLDYICRVMCDYLDSFPLLASVCFAQAGDFIGGADGYAGFPGRCRKAMNSFFCATDKRFRFMGRMNDDVTAYTTWGQRGLVFLSFREISITQELTQTQPGGLSEMYKEFGTYTKSFYSVMYSPSCVKISSMGWKERRIHHMVQWGYAVPKIISPEYKKNEERVIPISEGYFI